jgi:hypothetical protein
MQRLTELEIPTPDERSRCAGLTIGIQRPYKRRERGSGDGVPSLHQFLHEPALSGHLSDDVPGHWSYSPKKIRW